jgi:hypothetical protein
MVPHHLDNGRSSALPRPPLRGAAALTERRKNICTFRSRSGYRLEWSWYPVYHHADIKQVEGVSEHKARFSKLRSKTFPTNDERSDDRIADISLNATQNFKGGSDG